MARRARGLLALVVLAGALVWLARRTHRYVNLPLAGAAVAVLVGLVAGWLVLARRRRRGSSRCATGPYAAALATAQARIAAFDAKANESLTLIARGSGGGFEKAWQRRPTRWRTTAGEATELTGRGPAVGRLRERAQGAAHARRRAASWEQAVAAATEPRRHEPGQHRRDRSTRSTTASADLLAATSATTASRRLAAPDGWLALAGAIGLLIGLLAAAAPGGASPSGWRSTGDAPPARRPRRRRPRPGHRGRLRVRRLRTHPGRRRATQPRPTANPGTATPAPAATGAAVTAANCLQSYAPQGALPGPGALPAGSTMAKIRKRGRLIAGVSADTLLLGARNPVTGQIEGFDIDVLQAVAEAIFGDPDKVELRVITAADRIPLLQDGSVDIVARNMTITCDRWKQIAFCAEYYRAGQKVLVPLGSHGHRAGRPEGQEGLRADGSTSLDKLRAVRRRHPRPGRHPHRLPGAVPAGQGRRHHR